MKIGIVVIFLAFLALVVPSLLFAGETRISFTFDDGSRTIFENGFPVLAKYNFPATLYLATGYIGDDPWYMNWNQVLVMNRLGWEIACHTNNHPHMTELSDSEIQAELDQSIKILKQYGYEAQSYASPYGEFDKKVLSAVKKRFQSHRRAWGGSNGFNNPDSFDLYDISAIELKNSMSFEDVRVLVDKAVKERKWLVFLLHSIVKEMPQEYEFSVQALERVAEYINEQKIKVVTISDYLKNREKENKK